MRSHELYTPTCYQTKPLDDISCRIWPSPTFNHKSHSLWAAGHVRILSQLHGAFPPTHFVTIKFQKPESVETLKRFTSVFTDAVWYSNKTTQKYIAGRWTLEIELDNSCHLHILVRAGLYPDSPRYFDEQYNPAEWLRSKTRKINTKLGTNALMQYCKPVETVQGSAAYVYKLNDPKVLLFGRELRLRLTGQFGKYFAGYNQKQISEAYESNKHFSRIESNADGICGDSSQEAEVYCSAGGNS